MSSSSRDAHVPPAGRALLWAHARGRAAASPTDVSPATDGPESVADNGTDGNDTALGVCVIGTDSPCNADRWSGLPVSLHAVPGGDLIAGTLSRLLGAAA